MFQINRKIVALTLICMVTALLPGCKEAQKKGDQVQAKDELSTEAMSRTEVKKETYKYDTVVRGDFYEAAPQNAKLYMSQSMAVRVVYEYGEMVFDEFVVKTRDEIQKGDVIAKVHIDVSDADLTEQELLIQRMEERIEADKKDYEEEDNRLKGEAYNTTGSQAQGIAMSQYKETVALHNQDINSRQRKVEKEKEKLSKMQYAKDLKEITAPCDGIVGNQTKLSAGDKITSKTILATVEPGHSNILTVNNSDNQYLYGQEVEVTISSGAGEQQYKGTVISASKDSLASQMDSSEAKILIDASKEEIPSNEEIKKIVVKGRTGELKNVLLLKNGSLSIDKFNAYATVVDENGNFVKKNVIIGGQNEKNILIIRGLKEGDQVVIP